MRYESLIAGAVILLFGVVLVSTNGVLLGVNLPHAIGLPSCSSASSGSSSSTPSLGCGFYAPGTIVCLFGLGMLANGLRSPSSRSLRSGAGAGSAVSPELLAAQLALAQQRMATVAAAPGTAPGSRFCPECGRGNAADAKFCQSCGKTIPPPAPPAPANP